MNPPPEELAVRLWDVATGKERNGPKPSALLVQALAFSPDGKRHIEALNSDVFSRRQAACVGSVLDLG